jgi:outer membrane protein TolC
MMKKSILFILLYCAWLTSAVHAETLSLRDALALGLAENYDLQIIGLDVERAQAATLGQNARFDVVAEMGINASGSEVPADSTLIEEDIVESEQTQVEAALNKQFATGLQTRLSLTGTRSDADSLADRLDPAYRTSLVLNLTQPLLKDMGSTINTSDIQISRTREQQAAYGYLSSAQKLASDIETTYLSLAQAEEDYKYALLARDLAQELLDGNQRKFDAGLIPITEVNQAKTAVAAREENVLLYRQQIALERNRLIELISHSDKTLGKDWNTQLPTNVSELSLSLDSALEQGMKQRPDLQQVRLELEASKVALVYAENQHLPRLDLEASLGVNGLSGDGTTASVYRGDWQDSLEDEGHSWYAGLRFSMPLQNSLAKAQYRDAAAQDKQSLYSLRRAEIAVESAIKTAHETATLGAERVKVALETAELAKTTLHQENRRLEEGLSDTFRILTFQSYLVDAKIREVAAITDYHKALASLYQAMGANLERYNIVAALPQQGAAQ